MRKAIILLLLAGIFGCEKDNNSDVSTVNVAGNWRANVRVQSCSPAQTCLSLGFIPGSNVIAIMNLAQNGTKVDGNYTYQGLGIASNVSGNVAADQLVLDGTVTNPLGRATTHLTGTVSGNVINASISHQITLTGGNSATIGGAGTFMR